MTRFYKAMEEGYLTAIGTGAGGEEITQEEYEHILSVIHARPEAAEGNVYKLKDDLTWELAPITTKREEKATQEDYIAALKELGVTLDEES